MPWKLIAKVATYALFGALFSAIGVVGGAAPFIQWRESTALLDVQTELAYCESRKPEAASEERCDLGVDYARNGITITCDGENLFQMMLFVEGINTGFTEAKGNTGTLIVEGYEIAAMRWAE